MTWIKIDIDLINHPKTKKLARNLDISIPAAIGHLISIWTWSMKYAEDGNLGKYDQDQMASAAIWVADSTEFVSAMIDANFLENDFRLHDWQDFAGALLEKRAANAERERMRRARLKESEQHVDNTCDAREERVYKR